MTYALCKPDLLLKRMVLLVAAFVGVNASAQEFKIDGDRYISVLQKKHEATDAEGEYLSEVFLGKYSGNSQAIDKIYFSSQAGRVTEVFSLDMDFDGVTEVVLISADEVRSDPEEGNSGAYTDVRVYKAENGALVKNKKLSEIFSGGIDKVVDFTTDKLVYKFIYPYKTLSGIKQLVSAQLYKDFISSGSADYIMQSKTTIYKEPYAFPSKMYLIAGDKIKITEINGGWITFLYTSAKKEQIQASAPIGGCSSSGFGTIQLQNCPSEK